MAGFDMFANMGTSHNVTERKISKLLKERFERYKDDSFSNDDYSSLFVFLDVLLDLTSPEDVAALPVVFIDMFYNISAEAYRLTDDTYTLIGNKSPLNPGWHPSPDYKPQTIDCHYLNINQSEYSCIETDRNLSSCNCNCVCIPMQARPCSYLQEPCSTLIGLLVLYPSEVITEHKLIVLSKLCSMYGIIVDDTRSAQLDSAHLNFIKNIVKDIGHNILGPSMTFKLLLHQLRNSIKSVDTTIEKALNHELDVDTALSQLKHLGEKLQTQMHEVELNYTSSSLFLESLLRESNFVEGRYVLRITKVNLLKQVLRPLSEQFLSMFSDKKIVMELTASPDCEELFVEADLGLISQVVANLFSNAVKYTSIAPNSKNVYMSCSMILSKPLSRPEVLVSVITSGKSVQDKEAVHLFERDFRASNIGNNPGSGKGLFFIKDIVELHSGEVGYKPVYDGNMFYFTLPIEQ